MRTTGSRQGWSSDSFMTKFRHDCFLAKPISKKLTTTIAKMSIYFCRLIIRIISLTLLLFASRRRYRLSILCCHLGNRSRSCHLVHSAKGWQVEMIEHWCESFNKWRRSGWIHFLLTCFDFSFWKIELNTN